jgi:hypothetical protein
LPSFFYSTNGASTFSSSTFLSSFLLLPDFFDFYDFDVKVLLKFFSRILSTIIICPRIPPRPPTTGFTSPFPSISETSKSAIGAYGAPFLMNSLSISSLKANLSASNLSLSFSSLLFLFYSNFSASYLSFSNFTLSFLSFSF